VLLVGGLAWSVAARPIPSVALADAARWEGQTVRAEGWATDLRGDGAGLALMLRDGAASLEVRLDRAPAPDLLAGGDRVQAVGRLSRWQGQLELDGAAADARVVPGPRPAQATLADIATRPAAWQGTLLRLTGRVDHGRLVAGGNAIALGSGPWPSGGDVVATGLLRDDPACLCLRLDAREVAPWTP